MFMNPDKNRIKTEKHEKRKSAQEAEKSIWDELLSHRENTTQIRQI
jgi:hypothetical protein